MFVGIACKSKTKHPKRAYELCFKGTLQNVLTMCSSQAIPDYDEFVSSSDLEKCVSASVSQQWMLCSEWVPSEWESKQLIKTSQ